MNTRQAKLLMAIIDEFITTALPVGSKQIIESGRFAVSGATIRNEMRLLGEEGFIEQPHISAGRIPTAKGYRMYVQEFMEPTAHELKVRKKFETLKQQYEERKDQERVYEAVALLSQMMPNLAFAIGYTNSSWTLKIGLLCETNPSLSFAEIVERELGSAGVTARPLALTEA